MDIDKKAALVRLRQSIVDDAACSLLADQATQLVMGEGNLDADIVFVGEAPGKREDELGRPFVGASGKLLDEMLSSIGVERSDVYITNVVKYRPPNNRDPSPGEKRAFLPYLLEQIDIIEPQVVVTLGRHSMEYFLPGAKIGHVHGRQVAYSREVAPSRSQADLLVMPLYHPAAALYNRALREPLFSDMRRLAELLDPKTDKS